MRKNIHLLRIHLLRIERYLKFSFLKSGGVYLRNRGIGLQHEEKREQNYREKCYEKESCWGQPAPHSNLFIRHQLYFCPYILCNKYVHLQYISPFLETRSVSFTCFWKTQSSFLQTVYQWCLFLRYYLSLRFITSVNVKFIH